LGKNACAIPTLAVRVRAAAVLEVAEGSQSEFENFVAPSAVYTCDEANSACVMFITRMI
jgi:hypothetical protein